MKKAILLFCLLLFSIVLSIPRPVQATYTKTYYITQSSDDCVKCDTTNLSINSTTAKLGVFSGSTYQDNGFRFDVDFTAEEALHIKSCQLYVRGNGYTSGSVNFRLYGEYNLNPTTFIDGNVTDFDNRVRTTNSYPFTTNTVSGTWYNINVLTILNEIINDLGAPDYFVLFWTRISGNYQRQVRTYDYGSGSIPYLEMVFYSPYYCTFYHNNENGSYDLASSYFDFTSFDMENGTQTMFYDNQVSYGNLFFKSIFNGSYVFNYYTENITSTNSTDNPYEWSITENCGNLTVWAYSNSTQILPTLENEQVFEYNNQTTANVSSGIFGDYWRGQTFTIGTVSDNVAWYLTSLNISFTKLGTPNNLIVGIRNTENGLPIGNDLTNFTLDGNNLPSSLETPHPFKIYTFSTFITLEPSTTYAIVFRAPNGSENNEVDCWLDENATYTGGPRLDSSDGGLNWTTNNGDYFFELRGIALGNEEATLTEGIFIGSILLGALGLFGFLFFLAKRRD